MTMRWRQYEIPLDDVNGYRPEMVALKAIVERLEAVVDAIDRLHEALISKETP